MPVLRLRAPGGRRWTLREIVQGQPLGHPTHVMLVHYPVALPPVVLALDLVTRVGGPEPSLVGAGAYLSIAAAALSLLAAIPGLVDWWGMIPGSPKRRVATTHLLIQSGTIALLVVSALARWPDRSAGQAPVLATALNAAALVSVLLGNYFGGELVYRLGMRVSTGGSRRDDRP